MPERIWDLSKPSAAALASPAAVLAGGALKLRRHDPETGRYHPDGVLEATEVLLPGAPASALESFYGFRIDGDENGGAIRFRVSTDGGATFWWFDGVSWFEATEPDEWNTAEEIDATIPGLQAAPGRHLALAVRLEPSPNGRQSPELRRVVVFLSYEYDFLEDLARSVKRHLEEQMSIRSVWRGDAAGATEVTIETDLHVLEPVQAFDLAADPDRVIDIFDGLNGKTVSLSAPANGTVEVRFRGRPPVHIAADVDYQLSEIPSVVLQFPQATEIRKLRSGDRHLDWARARGVVRERLQPVWMSASVIISCQGEKRRETLAMTDALARILEQHRTVRSLATGEEFTVTIYGPSNTADRVSEGLAVIQTAITLVGPAWLDVADEKRLAEVIGFGIGDMQHRYEEVEVR